MRWFKFYGKDFLTDTKLIGCDPLLKTIWVTLLCLADDEGVINYIDEYDLQRLAGCDDNVSGDPTDFERTKGCLAFFESRGMITIEENRNENVTRGVTRRVTLCNYTRRQTENLSNAERQKKYRERQKLALKLPKEERNERNVTQRNTRYTRIEQNRIDSISNTNTAKSHTGESDLSEYGKESINLILESFKNLYGFPPTDKYPRRVAHNLDQQLSTLLKKRGKDPSNGIKTKAIGDYFKWVSKQEWAEKIQNLDTIRRKLSIFEAQLPEVK